MEAEVCFNQGDILNAEIALDKAMIMCDKYSAKLMPPSKRVILFFITTPVSVKSFKEV